MLFKDGDQRGMIPGIVLFLGLIICQSGCAYWMHLEITEDQKPVTLFDRYEMDIAGGGIDSTTVYIDIAFIDKISDTMNIDDIPILMIDTICFECEFMDDPSCLRILTDKEAHQRRVADGISDSVPRFPQYVVPPIRDDLHFSGGELRVSGFDGYPQAAYISKECRFADAIFTARLIDRVTGKEIARETNTVRIKIDRLYRLRSVS